ncbi:MAG: hypothetical protein NXH96_02655 [Alteromonadaceae bacterium]|nr:hypothetical protein [Alteromonadaceae bacterium]
MFLKKYLVLKEAKKNAEAREKATEHYAISGYGVAYRKASDYLRDERVTSFLKEAEKVSPAQ